MSQFWKSLESPHFFRIVKVKTFDLKKELQQPLQDLRFVEEEENNIEEDIVVFDTVVLVET